METVYTAKVPALFKDPELRLGAESNISGVKWSAVVILNSVLDSIIVSGSQSKLGPRDEMV